jgi:hypothetical protein
MQELVRSMGVRSRTENSSHHKLCLWPEVVQESQERNRHPFGYCQSLVSIVDLTSLPNSVFQRFWKNWSIETISKNCIKDCDFGIVRGVFSQSLHDELFGILSFLGRWQTNRESGRSVWQHYISSFGQNRYSFYAGENDLRFPSSQNQGFHDIGAHSLQSINSREGLDCFLSHFRSKFKEFFIAIWRNINFKFLDHDSSLLIFQSFKKVSKDSKGTGDKA